MEVCGRTKWSAGFTSAARPMFTREGGSGEARISSLIRKDAPSRQISARSGDDVLASVLASNSF